MSARESSPTARRRRLGAELRRLRETAGLTSYEASERLGWSSNSKTSRIENGRISVAWGDVSDMLDLYGVGPGETHNRLIALARKSKEKSWWQPFSDLLDKEYATVIDLETAASQLRIFQALAIPGLLQTPDYARAIITRSGPLDLDEEEVERRVQLRMQRQAILARDGDLGLWVVLDEAALRRVIGSSQIMHGQLIHLAREARQPNVTVQVIPYDVGPHASLPGSAGIFSFPQPRDRDVVFVDTLAGTLFLEREADVRAATLGFDHLRASALSVAESVEMISAVAESYR
ncbi:helix-turn-helix domain-containing protein [Actinoallomurus purpureus]|uniref:helix-turn-helix domain-containing protein n=1 Tax=Actinoallomurus purpureus TaxID=478114 RepID=UPI002093CA74|nr:helix-turn-helix transcriptional regulator [Actinoallomurus purpureus]MCO6006054.1 helix-turn-helix domain-containing protein [Actinoallomurus purpureus]